MTTWMYSSALVGLRTPGLVDVVVCKPTLPFSNTERDVQQIAAVSLKLALFAFNRVQVDDILCVAHFLRPGGDLHLGQLGVGSRGHQAHTDDVATVTIDCATIRRDGTIMLAPVVVELPLDVAANRA